MTTGREDPLGSSGQIVAAGSASGSIYDLGYRRYDGVRHGRSEAVWSLIRQSFRQVWGLGRPARSKVIPMGLAAIALIPAIVALGVSAIFRQIGGQELERLSPIRYDSYFSFIVQPLTLFTAAQAPELLGRDMRHRVLALYFSRSIRREDYALAKLAALGLSMLVFILLPQAVIFLGRVVLGADLLASLQDELPSLPPVLAQAVVTTALLAGLGLAIASFTPRRAYATVAIFAAFIIPAIAKVVIEELAGGDLAGPVSLISPTDVLAGANAFFYDVGRAAPRGSDLPAVAYPIAALVLALAAIGILVRRYRTIEP